MSLENQPNDKPTAREALTQKLADARVNCLVLGFPKCGTTAFADWIDLCSEIEVSNPKETFQLCPEFGENSKRAASVPLQKMFGSTAPNRVEATTLNVYSDQLRQAVAASPNVKVILLLRDSVQSVVSWHNQMLQADLANSPDFSAAWQHGLTLNSQSGNEFLQRYHRICSFGFWVEQWLATVGHERLLLVSNSELRKNDTEELRSVLSRFLEMRIELPDQVPERNVYSSIRFPLLYRLLRSQTAKTFFRKLEQTFTSFGPLRRFVRDRVMLRRKQKDLPDRSDVPLSEYFREDSETADKLLNQNRSYWSNQRKLVGIS